MPLQFYVFPPDEDKARRDFSVIPDIMRSHVARFGEYPFLREKYGVAEFATYSFREHQTLPSYAEKLITGDHANDADPGARARTSVVRQQPFRSRLAARVAERRLRNVRRDALAGAPQRRAPRITPR